MIDQILGANNPLPPLRSIGVLQQLNTDATQVSKVDIAGLIAGGLLGWYIATRFPKTTLKLVSVMIGAEIGILIARAVTKK